MGQLVDGVWHDTWYETKSTGGHFKRSESAFRNWVTPDGTPGLTANGGFPAQSGRYHLYVSLACPWAHRTLLMRQLKGLEDHIAVSVVHPLMLDHGWTFGTDFEGATGDSLYQHEFLYQLYLHAKPDYSGRVTVPVLWDTEQHTIVSNESADIIRMLNSAFDCVGATAGDYYPEALRAQIDELNGWIYDKVNNGVYKAGFATSQSAYDGAATTVFAALSELEAILAKQRYLTGDRLTEADLRLWTTLIRFDPVYHTHFKCDKYRLSDYPNLFGFLRDIYQMPGIADTVDMAHIRHHYYRSHGTINPHGVISLGPEQDLNQPHQRDKTFVSLY
ncbi:glutathione S-transferase family protein [Pectobacterium sp. CFBP8739]|uniref:glutathione S-transferase family protein n=1 Tax=Pectobacterium sp. CFBP8739 TaxID=2748908 RepID=UPI0015DFF1BC|nr:glutathione S-transferase family protein [Pectobacterium sp. CFBP8739]MBA0168235.1 glutathione S-transferase family protein [Pectobacterium sp. CFBP8739]